MKAEDSLREWISANQMENKEFSFEEVYGYEQGLELDSQIKFWIQY